MIVDLDAFGLPFGEQTPLPSKFYNASLLLYSRIIEGLRSYALLHLSYVVDLRLSHLYILLAVGYDVAAGLS